MMCAERVSEKERDRNGEGLCDTGIRSVGLMP